MIEVLDFFVERGVRPSDSANQEVFDAIAAWAVVKGCGDIEDNQGSNVICRAVALSKGRRGVVERRVANLRSREMAALNGPRRGIRVCPVLSR